MTGPRSLGAGELIDGAGAAVVDGVTAVAGVAVPVLGAGAGFDEHGTVVVMVTVMAVQGVQAVVS